MKDDVRKFIGKGCKVSWHMNIQGEYSGLTASHSSGVVGGAPIRFVPK
jgi:hypothetical protein